MNNHNASEDIIGILSGVIGYIFSVTKFISFKLIFVTTPFLPSISEAIHSIVVAVLCAMAGFITTRICHFIFVRFKIKIKSVYEKYFKKL